MTNKEVLQIAMRQSAADLQCRESDFLKEKNVIIEAGLGPNAKRYYREPIACNLISYGNNIVAATKSEYRDIVEEYLGKFEFFHCFETPNLHWLNERLEQKGQRICFMAEYYLPDLNRLQELPCDYELRLLGPEDFSSLYTKEWSNALCEDRKELDMLGVGAYDQGKLVGMAGCS
ncbi:MAG: GNAT family N-acetyltransferase, partial [Lachnospiraceae bacterium]